MQIYLPVHQTARGEKVLNGIDAFGFYHQMVVLYIEHLDDTCRTYISLRDPCIEAVATKVVEAVHIQLPADQLMKETFGIFVLEYLDGECELPVHLFVDTFHEHQGNVFVRYALDNGILQYVRERTMPDVVHQDGCLYGFSFTVEDEIAFGCKLLDGLAHQVEGSE